MDVLLQLAEVLDPGVIALVQVQADEARVLHEAGRLQRLERARGSEAWEGVLQRCLALGVGLFADGQDPVLPVVAQEHGSEGDRLEGARPRLLRGEEGHLSGR